MPGVNYMGGKRLVYLLVIVYFVIHTILAMLRRPEQKTPQDVYRRDSLVVDV